MNLNDIKNNGLQHDFILLDRSGSMRGLWSEIIGSVNLYVERLAASGVDTGVTLAVFDSAEMRGGMTFEIIRDRIIPKTWRKVEVTEVEPRGWTPLNDATGKIVNLATAGNYAKVAIIIATDGHENASTELTVTQAKLLLDQCRARGWQVIFLGANFDNAAQAQSYGTGMRQTVSMAAGNFASTMGLMANKREAYGSGCAATMDWSDAEKTQAASGGSGGGNSTGGTAGGGTAGQQSQ